MELFFSYCYNILRLQVKIIKLPLVDFYFNGALTAKETLIN